ncbi:hypothetical protein FRC06_000594 [Ceratobasidium sp. 370]|nr:hypothetical protein FRC06_000594 [Ceratobasidium sp. 370]
MKRPITKWPSKAHPMKQAPPGNAVACPVGTDDQGRSGVDQAERKHVARAHDPTAPGKLSESSGHGNLSAVGAEPTATYEEEEVPPSARAQLIVLLRSLETPNAMDAFDAYLTHDSRPIDKVFLSPFARSLWEGMMCEDPEIATWAAWSRKSTENWERTGWSNFVKCWKDVGLGLTSQRMDEWDPKLGWVIWSMKQRGGVW